MNRKSVTPTSLLRRPAPESCFHPLFLFFRLLPPLRFLIFQIRPLPRVVIKIYSPPFKRRAAGDVRTMSIQVMGSKVGKKSQRKIKLNFQTSRVDSKDKVSFFLSLDTFAFYPPPLQPRPLLPVPENIRKTSENMSLLSLVFLVLTLNR